MKKPTATSCVLALVLTSTAHGQVYEDEDLLKNKTRRSVETIQSQPTIELPDSDTTVRAPLFIPRIDPSLSVKLILANGQEFTASEGTLDVPAGPIRVFATRNHPSGQSDVMNYTVDVTPDGNYLPLPRMVDLYVGGRHQTSWFQPHTNSNPPTDIRVTVPGKTATLPATAEGLLLPEGEAVRIDLPESHPAFGAHSKWATESSTLGGLSMMTVGSMTGGAALLGFGFVWLSDAQSNKAKAEEISDPDDQAKFRRLDLQFDKSLRKSHIFFGAGAALLGAGFTLAIGPTAKKTKRAQKYKTEYEALVPIQLTPYAAESSLMPTRTKLPSMVPPSTDTPEPLSPPSNPASNPPLEPESEPSSGGGVWGQ